MMIVRQEVRSCILMKYEYLTTSDGYYSSPSTLLRVNLSDQPPMNQNIYKDCGVTFCIIFTFARENERMGERS